MWAQGEKGFFRAITGRAQAVGAYAHPGEEGDQGDVMEDLGSKGFFFLPKTNSLIFSTMAPSQNLS